MQSYRIRGFLLIEEFLSEVEFPTESRTIVKKLCRVISWGKVLSLILHFCLRKFNKYNSFIRVTLSVLELSELFFVYFHMVLFLLYV